MKRCKYCGAVLVEGRCPNSTCFDCVKPVEQVKVKKSTAKKAKTEKANE